MSFAQYIPNFPNVQVTAAWSSAAAVLSDLENSGFDWLMTKVYTVTLWEGLKDPDDWAKLTVTSGAGTLSVNFTSAPSVGDEAFVTGISFA